MSYSIQAGADPASKIKDSVTLTVAQVVCKRDGSDIGGGSGAAAQEVQGTTPAGATAIGNPVQVGSVVVDPASQPTYSMGQAAPLNADENGNLMVNDRLKTTADQITILPKQYSTQSTFTPVTAPGTVFTIAAGQKGVIQNLAAAALYVKLGATASSSSFSFILPGCTIALDGTSPRVDIDDFVGAVSIKAATGTENALAYLLS